MKAALLCTQAEQSVQQSPALHANANHPMQQQPVSTDEALSPKLVRRRQVAQQKKHTQEQQRLVDLREQLAKVISIEVGKLPLKDTAADKQHRADWQTGCVPRIAALKHLGHVELCNMINNYNRRPGDKHLNVSGHELLAQRLGWSCVPDIKAPTAEVGNQDCAWSHCVQEVDMLSLNWFHQGSCACLHL